MLGLPGSQVAASMKAGDDTIHWSWELRWMGAADGR